MGTLLLSRRSWSVHLVRGRPGGRFHVGSVGRPTDSSTWRSMACGRHRRHISSLLIASDSFSRVVALHKFVLCMCVCV